MTELSASPDTAAPPRPVASSHASRGTSGRGPTGTVPRAGLTSLPAPDDLLAAAGDERSFSTFHDLVRPRVVGVARRVLRDHAFAEDVSQEVLVEAWQKADRFEPARGSAMGWITTLANRRAVDRVRSEQARRNRDAHVSWRDRPAPFDTVSDEVETRLEHGQVQQALATLTELQREAIELAYVYGHTYRDVATVLGIPVGTAKSRLRDGLARLREVLEEAA